MTLRWRELSIAFMLAVALWYLVTGSEKVESQIRVRVDYRGLPAGLTIRSGMVNRIAVRVRASIGRIHSLSGRDFAYFVDLSSLKQGENTLAIDLSRLPVPSGVEVIDALPSRIILDVDTLGQKTVPVLANVKGSPPEDYVAQATVMPAELVISGAASDLAAIELVSIPVSMPDPPVPGVTEVSVLPPLPDCIDAKPAKLQVSLHIGIKRKLVLTTRAVHVENTGQFKAHKQPDKVSISLAVPQSHAEATASDSAVKAVVVLERQAPGVYSLPVRVYAPEGTELVKVEPDHISVTLEAPAAKGKNSRK